MKVQKILMMNCKLKIGDDVIVSEKATINAGKTGTITHINQSVQVYEVTYDKEQEDLWHGFSSYPYFTNEIELNISKIRDKTLRYILETPTDNDRNNRTENNPAKP